MGCGKWDVGRGLWEKECRKGTGGKGMLEGGCGKRDVGRGLWEKGCWEGDDDNAVHQVSVNQYTLSCVKTAPVGLLTSMVYERHD